MYFVSSFAFLMSSIEVRLYSYSSQILLLFFSSKRTKARGNWVPARGTKRTNEPFSEILFPRPELRENFAPSKDSFCCFSSCGEPGGLWSFPKFLNFRRKREQALRQNASKQPRSFKKEEQEFCVRGKERWQRRRSVRVTPGSLCYMLVLLSSW